MKRTRAVQWNWRKPVVFCAAAALAVGLAGCRTVGAPGGSADAGEAPVLKIGVTPNYPPIVFKQGANVVGIEPEFARELGRELGRPVRLVEVEWEKQIDALLSGSIDMIMSGMTITDARKVRIAFSNPYLTQGLMAMCRARDAKKYDSLDKIKDANVVFGAERGSTAEVYVQHQCLKKIKMVPVAPRDAAFFVASKRVDLLIHDGPAVMWMASENEAELAAIPLLLNTELYGWGLRKSDDALLAEVNRALAKWMADGTLNRIVGKWLPLAPPKP